MMYLAGAIYLLKVASVMTGIGLAVTISKDNDIKKLVKKVKSKMIESVKGFEIGKEHATVLGITQHGKTYATVKTMEQMKEAVLFFNSQHTKVGNGWVTATSANTPEQIYKVLEKGKKVNYLPKDENLDLMSQELGLLADQAYKMGRFDFRFVIDEVHLFWITKNNKGKNALIRLATTGLGRGFKCIFLSQRGAKVDNTLLTQSTKHILFALGDNDYSYLKSNGFEVEGMKEKIKGEKYVFVEYDLKNTSNPKMIKG
jgi:hypothetical protein